MKNINSKIYPLNIRNRSSIGTEHEAYIIAEIGTNHNRNLETARTMLYGVAKAGCDCAKFQIYEPNEIVSGRVRASDYGLDKIYGDISARQMFEDYLKTPKEWFPQLRDLCHELGLDFAATIHGREGLEWAKEIKLDVVKVASMDHTNLPFLHSLVNAVSAPILVSLGMAMIQDIDAIVKVLSKHEYGFGLFHCCAIYPPWSDELRLSNIPILVDKFSVPVGFSDHTVGVESSLKARSIGAMMFEKHVTLDKKQCGPDHSFAMEMSEFKRYVTALKKIPYNRVASNLNFIEPTKRELSNRVSYLKSIISKRALPVGHLLTVDDVYMARPGSGISPADLESILGGVLVRPIKEDIPLQLQDFKFNQE